MNFTGQSWEMEGKDPVAVVSVSPLLKTLPCGGQSNPALGFHRYLGDSGKLNPLIPVLQLDSRPWTPSGAGISPGHVHGTS